MLQGKAVVVSIFVVAIAMGGYAWWHHYSQGRRCIELWGTEAAELIRYAKQVEVLELAEGNDEGIESLTVDGQPVVLASVREITGQKGLVHARQALIEDASFDWEEEASRTRRWTFGLRFRRGEDAVTLLFDFVTRRVRLVGTDRQALLAPHIVAGYEEKLPVWLAVEGNGK